MDALVPVARLQRRDLPRDFEGRHSLDSQAMALCSPGSRAMVLRFPQHPWNVPGMGNTPHRHLRRKLCKDRDCPYLERLVARLVPDCRPCLFLRGAPEVRFLLGDLEKFYKK